MSTTSKKKATQKTSKADKLAPKSTAALTEAPSSFGDPAFFPFGRYTGVVGVHTTLLAFTALFLPRSTFLFEITRTDIDESKLTSRDRPQHPFLEDLTLNPALTTATICGGVILLQCWWAGFVRGWWVEYSLRGTEDEKRLERTKLEKDKLRQLTKAFLFTLAGSVPTHTLIVLLGAPLLSHIPQTYFLALTLSTLMFFTPAFVFGLPSLSSKTESLLIRLTWVRLFSEFSIRTPVERAMAYPAFGTALGCWLGAIPTALDWDRPWQAWPLTSLFGAILGYILSSMAALTISATKSLADDHLRTQKAE
ncbi:Glycosylphosphatidylinositol (GPI) anchor assembly protein [Marasmius tenuissimus]|uniref:Glycosylphosphatidylinositol (GPI) anchor assembly protein n=1 Tax=Marasmius tenuissimus TaxID=585030 RepID=A0ABR2ZK01_9AGAR|nr:Glycosylphosphatidylinositol (GPI) anchor assembly protein [Marasmius tenuissimus]